MLTMVVSRSNGCSIIVNFPLFRSRTYVHVRCFAVAYVCPGYLLEMQKCLQEPSPALLVRAPQKGRPSLNFGPGRASGLELCFSSTYLLKLLIFKEGNAV